MSMVRRRRARVLAYALLCALPFAMLGLSFVKSASRPVRTGARAAEQAVAQGPVHRPMKTVRAATISGRVSARDGRPIAAAAVCASCTACNVFLPDATRICTQTDAAGSFALTSVPAGDYLVSASAMGYAPKAGNGGRPVAVRGSDGAGASSVDIALDEGGAAVTGVVMDVTGGPVAGAMVRTISGGEANDAIRITQSTTTDEQGRFALSCPAGHVALHATAEGYAPGIASRTAPASDVEVFVVPSSSIEGLVVAEDGQSVAGLRVLAQAPSVLMREVTSDDSGRFKLSGLRSGVYQLRASGEGWLGDYPATVTLSTADTVRDLVITVRKAASVRGTLLAEDQTPCAGGRVHLGPGRRAYSVPVLEAIAGADGAITFDAVPAGSYEVAISCRGAEPQPAAPLEVGTENRAGLVWRMAPQLSIEGHVVDTHGRPVSKLMVELRTENRTPIMARGATSGPDGAFAFKGLSKGSFSLRSRDLEETVPVELGEWSVTDLRLRAKSMGYLRVRVTTPDGKPVDGLSVSAESSDGQASDLPEELGSGTYRLGPMQPGAYAVYASDGMNPRERAGGASGSYTVQEGATTELELRYGGYQGRISGRVLDDAGAPVENVWVQARPSDTAQDPLAELHQMTVIAEARRSLTDLEGRFEIDRLSESGTFTVTAEWPLGGQAKLEGVKAGATIELTMQQLASLSGTAVDPAGQPIAHLSLQLSNSQTGQQRTEVVFDPAGKWKLDRVTPGAIQLIANDPKGHVAVTTLNVAAKQDMSDVHLRLEPRGAQPPR